ncbi:MAG: NUDIX hydrolase [Nitrososphaerales archaeon]
MKREYPERPFAAVGAVIKKDGRVLLVKRRFEPSREKWSIPGGLVELGERVKDAVKREILEEVGLEIKLIKLIDVVDNITRDKDGRIRFHYILSDYLAAPKGGVLKGNEEVLDIGWFTPEEASKLNLTKTSRHLLKKIGFLKPKKRS